MTIGEIKVGFLAIRESTMDFGEVSVASRLRPDNGGPRVDIKVPPVDWRFASRLGSPWSSCLEHVWKGQVQGSRFPGFA